MGRCGGEEYPEFDSATRTRVVETLRGRGVIIPDPDHVYVSPDAKVESGTVLLPGTCLRGPCEVGPDCRLGPDCWVEDSAIEADCVVWYSVLEAARVRRGSTIGPFTHLRPGADVGPEARVGNFVEVKAARIGRGAKAGHLAYIGDAEVGEGVNIGAGAVTCNFDGVAKHRTVIEDGAFVGTNASLVAPVRIGENAFIAAGSTITEDVPPNSTAFGRARQVVRKRECEEDAR
jgi:bifunctional UDP-N-acetylglucosamine pyrophosphorylase/glucosamine-1-phosphate N-acetyltransferase